MRNRFLAGALALVLAAPQAWAFEILRLEPRNFGEEREFLEPIARRAAEDSFVDWSFDSFVFVGRHDLNRDGQYELIVGIETTAHCGRDDNFLISCAAYIYQRVDGEWRLIGDIFAEPRKIDGRGVLFITGEDAYHAGWRVIGHGDDLYCWAKAVPSFQAGRVADNLHGYTATSKRDMPCPWWAKDQK